MGFFVFRFFSPEVWDPLRLKYPEKKKTDFLREKKLIRARLGRGTWSTCEKNQGLVSQKRRGHWTLKEFGAISLN